MNTFYLRPATVDDFEFFFQLHKQALGPYVERIWGWNDEYQRAYLKRTLDIDTTQVIVVGGADVGRLNLAYLEDDVYIGLIEISPDHQRRGIGGRVINTVLDTAFTESRGVRLHVLAVNEGAYRLYRRLGFREVRREGEPPEVRIKMRADPSATALRRPVGGPWRVRSATTDDRSFIIEMARQACVIEDWPLPDADSDDVHSLLPGNEDVAIIASDVLDRPVGAAWTLHSTPALMVDEAGTSVPELCIAVTPEIRGRGVGGALLDELARRCAPHHDALCLNVHQRNAAARKLYVRAGFEETGQGRGPLGVAMRKHLGSESTTRAKAT